MRVTHICTVSELTPVDMGRVGVTAIDKRPVDGPISVGTYGLWGDVQADRANHGGIDKAVYAMSNAEMRWWEQQLGEELAPGVFGENLRVDGDVDDIIIGTRLRFGTALLEATGCRTPCRTFEWWRGEEGWIKRFIARGRPGTHFRVIEPGHAQAGDRLEVLTVPTHGVSAGRWFRERPAPAPALIDAHDRGEITLASYIIKHMPTELRDAMATDKQVL
ncbi:MOSC domain-containing protein [Flaviflexus huanghaiensis]|uniref:MOSC domain-containing protein n=1 Tax=Flaviflexus huanghaiensis TaxID=1111473 RepID=UPI0015F9B159|nr:MOSC domain-containing protein [Flaviflexus huanghaiensis]